MKYHLDCYWFTKHKNALSLYSKVAIILLNKISTLHLKGDLLGGLTAAVIALPLALAFGVSSGAGAIAGVYGAIFVGFLLRYLH